MEENDYMDSFIDTNVSIAYSFIIDPFNIKSNSIFNRYDKIFWSANVKKEYEGVFNEKLRNMRSYFKDLQSYLLRLDYEDVSLNKLFIFLHENYPKGFKKKVKSSLPRFWDMYVDNSYPAKDDVLESIRHCLFDLQSDSFEKREEIYSKIYLTPERKEKYEDICDQLLKKHDVHKSDAIIVLDAHDYNLKLKSKIDFITFDMCFYNAICQIDQFSFNEVLGKDDYN